MIFRLYFFLETVAIECFHVTFPAKISFRHVGVPSRLVSCDLRSFTSHLHQKRYVRRKIKLPNCLNMQIRLILSLRKGTCQNNDAEFLPSTESIDLVSYLVLETSYCSKAQFKTFKILQAYNRLVSGFVQSVKLNHCRLILLSTPTATLYNWENYNDFVVCSIKVNFEFVCQKVTPN